MLRGRAGIGRRLPDPMQFRTFIHLVDPDVKRCNALIRNLSLRDLHVEACPAQPTSADPLHRVCSVVGLSNPFSTADLERIKALRRSSSVIAAYAQNATSLTLGSRCEVVLAGAPILLDSSAADFETELAQVITEAVKLQDRQLQEEQRTLKVMQDMAIIGRSSSMLGVFRLAQRVSHFSDLPVLITGETGTGKELLAHAIYRQDEKRCHGPLVSLNCAALNRELSDSELFGHRKGSFTGADRNRLGLFRAADNGVLFLDEIGDLDLRLQAKLLRVLQNGRVLGVGEDQETTVNVRVLAATNRDLARMVTEATFREDLYHRLNVISIYIPPLRERSDDVGLLVDYFMKKCNNGVSDKPITAEPSFIEALQLASLPGNIRQLENLVRRAVISSDGLHPLGIGDLPPELWQEIMTKSGSHVPVGGTHLKSETHDNGVAFLDEILLRNNFSLDNCIDELEERLVQTVLASCRGNQAQTARLLGITPRSVYNKLKKRREMLSDRKIAST